jgi:membrane-associated PAP2 superfamily phosphatase
VSALLRQDLLVAALALALLVGWDASGLDLVVVRQEAGSTGFPLRHAWLTSRVMHDGGRALGWAVLIVLLVNVWRPLAPIALAERRERVRWVLLTLACLLVIPALKRYSLTSCPWDLAEFGGMAQYVSHWRFGVADGGPGRCFPSGHATAAFAFLAGYFALRPQRPRAARGWLAGVLVVGVLFGWAQMARGAHYPSHTMWSAWLCWVVCLVGAAIRPAVAAAPVIAAPAPARSA